MSLKQFFGFLLVALVAVIVILLGAGFRFWWASEPLVPPPKVVGSIADPNPPQPQTTCVTYGLQQVSFKIELPFKQICKTVYQ